MELLCILKKSKPDWLHWRLSFPFWCSYRLMRLQVWHLQSLSSLCDCRAVSKFQMIILVKLVNFSVCDSRKYLCPPQGGMLEISMGEELSLNQNCNSLRGGGMDILWINTSSNNFQVFSWTVSTHSSPVFLAHQTIDNN